MNARRISWLLQIAVAVILGQTLFFKFTGAAESVYIFTRVGAEPWGRLATGVAELAAAGLLVVPGTAVYGAILAFGLMSGALVSHLAILGIEVMGDGGLLFGLALATWAASAGIVAIRRRELPIPGARRAQLRQARS